MKRHEHEARAYTDGRPNPWVCLICKRPIRQKPNLRWVLDR